MQLYKIESGFSSEEEICEKINQVTRSRINRLQTSARCRMDISIEYNRVENGHLVAYIFANKKGLEVLKTTIDIVGATNGTLKDITEDILLNGMEMPENDVFYSIYEKFIIDHLSVDRILDNINKKGIEKLTPLEKTILEAF